MAELAGPHPPGDYPVVIIGSGPGGLQVAYSLRRLGIRHALLSSDPGPGGMFRRWPFFQRLLSWTKPFAPPEPGSREYERYDWNSLLGDEPDTRAIMRDLMDGSSYFPSRPEMETNLGEFVARSELQVRQSCTWTSTRLLDGPDDLRWAVETTDGTYRAAVLVVAVGVAQPFTPPGRGMELTHHYADVRPPDTYAGKRVFIIGKQNSGFELANGLLPWARQLILSSPSPAHLSVETRSLVGVRARYVQPFEDHVLGGGVTILEASLDGIERVEGGDGALLVRVKRSDGGASLDLEVDEVIAATGFTAPLVDLADLGAQVVGRSGLPALTAWWESATLPGLYFAGTLSQAAKGLQKHGMPANSGAVHGARYNARVLAAHLATTHFGGTRPRPSVAADGLVDMIATELTQAPELWHQRGYLARVITLDPEAGLVDDGVQPLTHVLDSTGPDLLAITLEADGSGALYPCLYTRRAGAISEHPIAPNALLRYDGADTRSAIASVVSSVVPGAVSGS